jgi:hypothetical protein
MLTEREAFKFGFLKRCAEEGLSKEEADNRVKLAYDKLQHIKSGDWRTLVPGLSKLLLMDVPLAVGGLGIGAAGTAGVAGGLGLAKATEPEGDSEEAKTRELIDALHMHSERARRNRLRREIRQ